MSNLSKIRLIQGDCTDVLRKMGKVRCIFMDPPDNIGLSYDGYLDKISENEYYYWIEWLIRRSMELAEIVWIAYYWKHDLEIKYRLRDILKYSHPQWQAKTILWRWTFGTQLKNDLTSCFRYILRLSSPGVIWNMSQVKIPSVRQIIGDPRACIDGKNPDDVWDVSRVTGNSNERRSWHPTQIPELVMKRIIGMSMNQPDQVFVDLFEGSGTSIRCCRDLNVRHVGIELSDSYVKELSREHSLIPEIFEGQKIVF